MNQKTAGAARRYAAALLEVAVETGADALALRGELESVGALLERERELHAALAHPALGPERRRALAQQVFGGRASELLARLLGLLAEKGRIGLLGEITRAYVSALRERQGVLAARAATAVPLDAGQIEALRQALRGLTGREVELETAVEPALLGGASVTLGGRTYDGSVRWRLHSLRARLMHGA